VNERTAIELPRHVRNYVRSVFRLVNRRVARRICQFPTGHEEALDMTLIEAISEHGQETLLDDGWIIRIETHFLGGMRHWNGWEVADIGVLAIFRRSGRVEKVKAALLQSKRLYPDEQCQDEADLSDYSIGFARLYADMGSRSPILSPRTFNFSETSRYRTLEIGNTQFKAIQQFTQSHRIPVEYLLYNPAILPWKTILPTSRFNKLSATFPVACRVVPFRALKAALDSSPNGYNPTYFDLATRLGAPFIFERSLAGWRLEAFVADELLRCREGYASVQASDDEFVAIFNRRSGPIAAAFAITIDAPSGPE